MRHIKSFILTTVALLPLSTSAFAADMYNYGTGAQSYNNYNAYTSVAPAWQGGYLGLYLGYGWSSFDVNQVGNIDDNAFNVGGFGGYNWQAGNVVFGLEGDVGYAWNESKKNTVRAEQGIEGSLRGRLGYSMGTWMPYATIGIAATQANIDSSIAGDESKVHLGLAAGIGAEAFLTQNLIGRIEYRHTDYDEKNYNLGWTSVKSDLSRNDLRVGIGVKF